MTQRDEDIIFQDTAIKREIMNTCEVMAHKMLALSDIARKHHAVWDDLDRVWIFPDGTRCGCALNFRSEKEVIFFKLDIPKGRGLQ
jgi:hypothetical protein